MPVEYRIIRYRSGERAVVLAVQTDTAGAETVHGPASREECEAFIARRTNPDLAGRSLAEVAAIINPEEASCS